MSFFNGIVKSNRLHKWIWHEHKCPWFWAQVMQDIKLRLLVAK